MFDPLFALLFLAAMAVVAVVVFWVIDRRTPFISRILISLTVTGVIWIAAIFLLSAALSWSNENAVTMYVFTPQSKAVRFTNDLGMIAQHHGLTPNPGQTTDDKGITTYILKADGHWLSLWSQNMPLGPDENPALCGHYTEGHNDPGQYILTVSPFLPFGSKRAAQALILKIDTELKASGYNVRSVAADCSPLSKLESKP